MFKKGLFVVFAVVALAAMVYGVIGTGAWFTDNETITGNSITTGTLDIKVWGGPFIGEKLEPGGDYVKLGVFCTQNVGDYNMKWRGWISDVAGTPGLKDYLVVQATMNPVGFVGNYGPTKELWKDVPFNSLTGPNPYIEISDAAEPLYPGYWACYQIDAKLLSTAPNTLQGAWLEAKFNIDATQRINPGYSE